jgi:hypothetical protein
MRCNSGLAFRRELLQVARKVRYNNKGQVHHLPRFQKREKQCLKKVTVRYVKESLRKENDIAETVNMIRLSTGFREIKPMIIKRIMTITLAALVLITSVTIYITPLSSVHASDDIYVPPELLNVTEEELRAMIDIINAHAEVGALDTLIMSGALGGAAAVKANSISAELKAKLAHTGISSKTAATWATGLKMAGIGAVAVDWIMVWNQITGRDDFATTYQHVSNPLSSFIINYTHLDIVGRAIVNTVMTDPLLFGFDASMEWDWDWNTAEMVNTGWSVINNWAKGIFGIKTATDGTPMTGLQLLPYIGAEQTLSILNATYVTRMTVGGLPDSHYYTLPFHTNLYIPSNGYYIMTSMGANGLEGRVRNLDGLHLFRDYWHHVTYPNTFNLQRNTTTYRLHLSIPVNASLEPRVTLYTVNNGVVQFNQVTNINGFNFCRSHLTRGEQPISNNIPALDGIIPAEGTTTINVPTVEDWATKSDFQNLYEFVQGLNNMNLPEQIEVANSVPVQPTFPLYNGNDVIDFSRHLVGQLQNIVISPSIDALLNGLIAELNQLIVIHQSMPIDWSDAVITLGVLQGVQSWLQQGINTGTWTGTGTISHPWTWTGTGLIPLTQTGVTTMTQTITAEIARITTKYGTPPIIPPVSGGLIMPDWPDPTEVFPFSIPFDIVRLVRIFGVDFQPPSPVFTLEFPSSIFLGGGVLEINMEVFVPIVRIVRMFMLLGFIFGMMKITSRVIKW